MIFNYTNKTAVITGGGRGIGRAIAELLLGLGCKVIITTTTLGAPKWLPKDNTANHMRLDFCDPGSLDTFIAELTAYKPIDILVNNAGMHIPQATTEIDEADWDKVFRVNVVGPMLLMKHLGKHMKQRKTGRIINISSIAGIVCKPNTSAYAASKMALIGLTRSSAIDLAPHNVLVNALCPGTTQTDMVESILSEEQKEQFILDIPLKRFAKPEEIANFVLFLASDLNTYITGQTIIVDGGRTIQ